MTDLAIMNHMCKKSLNSQSGFTLISVVMAGVIGMTVVLGMSKYLDYSFQAANALQRKAEASMTMDLLKMAIDDTTKCTSLLNAVNIDTGSGNPIFNRSLIPNENRPGGRVDLKRARIDGYTYADKNDTSTHTKSIAFVPISRLGTSNFYNGFLRVIFGQPSGANTALGGDFVRKIPLILEVDNGAAAYPTVVSCKRKRDIAHAPGAEIPPSHAYNSSVPSSPEIHVISMSGARSEARFVNFEAKCNCKESNGDFKSQARFKSGTTHLYGHTLCGVDGVSDTQTNRMTASSTLPIPDGTTSIEVISHNNSCDSRKIDFSARFYE